MILRSDKNTTKHLVMRDIDKPYVRTVQLIRGSPEVNAFQSATYESGLEHLSLGFFMQLQPRFLTASQFRQLYIQSCN